MKGKKYRTAYGKDLKHFMWFHMQSVPEVAKEDVQSAMFCKGIQLLNEGNTRELLFISLRNKKIDVLRKYKNDIVRANSICLEDVIVDDDMTIDGPLWDRTKHDYRGFLEVLYITLLRLTEVHQRYLALYIRQMARGMNPTNKKISELCGFNDKRGSAVWKKIKETAQQVHREGRAYELHRVRDLRDLLQRIRSC